MFLTTFFKAVNSRTRSEFRGGKVPQEFDPLTTGDFFEKPMRRFESLQGPLDLELFAFATSPYRLAVTGNTSSSHEFDPLATQMLTPFGSFLSHYIIFLRGKSTKKRNPSVKISKKKPSKRQYGLFFFSKT